MSADQIHDDYGAFAEAARRELVVPVSQGRPTLVTISIDRALTLPGFREDLQSDAAEDRLALVERIRSYSGSGVAILGEQSAEALLTRSRFFRGG